MKRFRQAVAVLLVWLPWMWLNGQEHDFCSWMKLELKHALKPAWTLSGHVEWRTKEDWGTTDRLGLGMHADYEWLPFLEVGAGYEAHYRNRGAEGWKFRHRYRLQGVLSARLRRLKVSLRERFQHTFGPTAGDREFRLRSRLKLAYDLARCKAEPYVSVEMYNGLGRGEHFGITRMRYRSGVSVPLGESWEAEVFYCRQAEHEKGKHVLGLECVYTF